MDLNILWILKFCLLHVLEDDVDLIELSDDDFGEVHEKDLLALILYLSENCQTFARPLWLYRI